MVCALWEVIAAHRALHRPKCSAEGVEAESRGRGSRRQANSESRQCAQVHRIRRSTDLKWVPKIFCCFLSSKLTRTGQEGMLSGRAW